MHICINCNAKYSGFLDFEGLVLIYDFRIVACFTQDVNFFLKS